MSFPTIPDGFGWPFVDMDTKRLPEPTMAAIADDVAAAVGDTDTPIGLALSDTYGPVAIAASPELAATIATEANRSAARSEYATKPNGDPSATLDSGQSVHFLQPATSRKPVVNGGRLVHGSTTGAGAGSYADYYQADMGAEASRIGARYVWPASPTNDGTMCIALWGDIYLASMGNDVPSSVCHFTITPRTGATGEWAWYVCDGVGHLFIVKQGTYVNPPRDGVTPWLTDAWVDRAAGTGSALLPDGQIITVTAAEVAAKFTALGYTPVAFEDLGASVAMWEHFASANGGTAVMPEYENIWAEVDPAPADVRTVTLETLNLVAKDLKVTYPPALKVHAPTTQLTVATTTSAATVDVSNAFVSTVAGATGKVKLEVCAWYEFTSADTLFWRARESTGATTSTTRVACVGVAGEKTLVRQSIEFGGFSAGAPVVLTLQHWTVSAGTATLKAGGAGGSMLPPMTLDATPY